MAERSALYRLIEAKLAPVTFEDFIATRRPQRAWQSIVDEIEESTGVHVGREVLRRWFAGRISYQVKVDAERVA